VLALFAFIVLLLAGAGLFLWFDHHLEAARQAAARGHNAVAITHLRSCRLVRAEHPEVLLLSACVARRGGAWTEAEALLDRYSELRGDDDALVLERLLLRATRGEIEATRPLLQLHIDQDDSAATLAREALAAGMLFRSRLEEADAFLTRWLEHDPDSTFAILAQGKLQDLREQSSEALRTFRRVLELDSEHDEARLRLTTILLTLSQGEEALPHLEYLRHRLPDNPEVLVQLAQALELQKRGAEARAILDDCLGRHPDHAGALAERGRIARQDGDAARSEELLRRSVQFDPGNAAAHYLLYLTLSLNNKPEEAARELEARTRIEADVQRIKELISGDLQARPNDPAVQHEIALITLRAGRPREAHRWLLNALQVGPDHVPTHRALAAYYRETGNPVLSARHRAIAQRLSQKQP
jgi:predicted Zn-dependent protease